MTTIFGKIIQGKLPAEKILENDEILVIKDLHPKAPLHFLIIPKKEIPDLQSMQPDDFSLLAKIVSTAQHLANQYQVADGYRLVVNNGPLAGQTISHLHVHFLAGGHLDGMA